MDCAIREGNWKLIWWFESDSLHLYNLKQDVGEKKNLIHTYSEMKENLLLKLKE